MSRFLIALAALAALGCNVTPTPMRQTASANASVSVTVLTEFDGIRLYRVDVGQRFVYVAAHLSNLSTSWEESCGKGCTREVQVATVGR